MPTAISLSSQVSNFVELFLKKDHVIILPTFFRLGNGQFLAFDTYTVLQTGDLRIGLTHPHKPCSLLTQVEVGHHLKAKILK